MQSFLSPLSLRRPRPTTSSAPLCSKSKYHCHCQTMTSTRVLVTGATGFIGGHLIPALQAQGHTVHTISRRLPYPPVPNVIHHSCDITDSVSLRTIVQSQNWHAILHLAGLVSYTSADATALQQINVTATDTLIKLVEQQCPRTRFIFCSSVAAVGSNKRFTDPPLNEDATWDKAAESVGYLRTKRQAEKLVTAAAAAGRVKASVLCPGNVYGAGDGAKGSRKTQVKAANGRWPIYTRGGVNVVHVRVVVQAFLRLVDDVSLDEPLWTGQRWLIVSDNVTIKDMLAMCAEFGGNARHAPRLCLPEWILWALCFFGQMLGSRSMTLDRFAVATRYHWFDGTRARKRFGLEEVSAREAIRDSVNWMRVRGMVTSRT